MGIHTGQVPIWTCATWFWVNIFLIYKILSLVDEVVYFVDINVSKNVVKEKWACISFTWIHAGYLSSLSLDVFRQRKDNNSWFHSSRVPGKWTILMRLTDFHYGNMKCYIFVYLLSTEPSGEPCSIFVYIFYKDAVALIWEMYKEY